jgi:hypothetical protein
MFIQDFSNPKDAITDEKQIKGWSRERKRFSFMEIGIKSMSRQNVKTVLLILIIKKISLEFTPQAMENHLSLPRNNRIDPM